MCWVSLPTLLPKVKLPTLELLSLCHPVLLKPLHFTGFKGCWQIALSSLILSFPKPALLNLDTILGQIIFVGDFARHCRIFSSTPGLCLLNVRSTPPTCDNQECLQTLPKVSWGKHRPSLRKDHCFMAMTRLMRSLWILA